MARLVWLLGGVSVVALFAASVLLGEVNQDEGWYLYASRLVTEGLFPYRDFAYTQGPVLPFVYAGLWPLYGGMGVLGGRVLTALLGLVALLCVAVLCRRLSPVSLRGVAGPLAFVVAGLNTYQTYFLSMVKTYSLTALLVVLGFLVLSVGWRRRGWLSAFLGGVLLGLAACTRLSAVALVPVVWVVLLLPVEYESGCVPWRRRLVAALALAMGCAVALGVCWGPFLATSPGNVWFALVEYHAGRDVGGLGKVLLYKAGFLYRLAGAYAGTWLLAVVALLVAWARRGAVVELVSRGYGGLGVAVLGGVLGVSALHFVAPFPYDDYQVFVMPLLSCVLVAGLCALLAGPAERAGVESRVRLEGLVLAGVLASALVLSYSSPMVQDWFIGPRDKIWWPVKETTSLKKLRETGRLIRSLAESQGGRDVILTQDTYLAVEAGLRLPRGLELGPFSYFPDWSDEKAARMHVVNRRSLRRILGETEAGIAAFSDYGFAISLPGVTPIAELERAELRGIVERRYGLFRDVQGFGQAATTLRIYLRKDG